MTPEKHFIPEFELQDANGRRAGTLGLPPLRELLVVRLDGCPECGRLARMLAARAREQALENAQVFVIADASSELAEAPFPVMRDDGGVGAKLSRDLGMPDAPLLAVADRYGVAYSARPVHGADPAELLADARDTLSWVAMQCPE